MVFKRGAGTGCTSGTYQRLKAGVVLRHDKYTRTTSDEYLFVPHPEPFGSTMCAIADHGDSGAAVWNALGELLGSFTGQSPQGSEKRGYSFVTPIDDVYADTEKFRVRKSLTSGFRHIEGHGFHLRISSCGGCEM